MSFLHVFGMKGFSWSSINIRDAWRAAAATAGRCVMRGEQLRPRPADAWFVARSCDHGRQMRDAWRAAAATVCRCVMRDEQLQPRTTTAWCVAGNCGHGRPLRDAWRETAATDDRCVMSGEQLRPRMTITWWVASSCGHGRPLRDTWRAAAATDDRCSGPNYGFVNSTARLNLTLSTAAENTGLHAYQRTSCKYTQERFQISKININSSAAWVNPITPI